MTNQQFTEKSREALAAAQQLTIEYQNQEVTQEHLAYALLSDAQGLIPQLSAAGKAALPSYLRHDHISPISLLLFLKAAENRPQNRFLQQTPPSLSAFG